MRMLYVAMPYEEGKSGISRYINETVKKFAAHDIQMDIMINKSDINAFEQSHLNNIKKIVINFGFLPKKLKVIFEIIFHLLFLPFWCKYKGYDLLFLPAGNRRLCLFYPVFTITTVHYFCQFHIPNKYDIFRTFYAKRFLPIFLKKVNFISSISQSTTNDLIDFLNIDPSIIFANPNGHNLPESNETSTSLNFKEKYILYVSRIEHPGKNHLNLLKAYELLPKTTRSEFKLLLVGSDWSGANKVHDYHKQMDDEVRSQVVFQGFVNDQDLTHFYKNASLFVYPSFYEGFGLPVLEAMGHGVPVICSGTSSLPELGGTAARYFGPNNPEEMKGGIETILNDSSLREQMINEGFRNIERYCWKQHVNNIIERVV